MAQHLLVTGGSGFIGSYVVAQARTLGYRVTSIDIRPPRAGFEPDRFHEVDIRDAAACRSVMSDGRQDAIIHLASDVSLGNSSLEGYSTTIEGTRNVVDAASRMADLRRFVHASTQFVVRPGVAPRDDLHLEPYTLYGAAKAETERLVRQSALLPVAAIVRPTVIWGPHHPSFAQHIFRVIAQRRYLHPVARSPILRAFGYVENTARQILAVAEADACEGGSVWYIGDDVLDYEVWADAFAVALTGRRARKVPAAILIGLARVGDALQRIGVPCPIDSGRAFRMTTSSAISLAPIQAIAGPARVGFDEGVRRTVQWLAGHRDLRDEGRGELPAASPAPRS